MSIMAVGALRGSTCSRRPTSPCRGAIGMRSGPAARNVDAALSGFVRTVATGSAVSSVAATDSAVVVAWDGRGIADSFSGWDQLLIPPGRPSRVARMGRGAWPHPIAKTLIVLSREKGST